MIMHGVALEKLDRASGFTLISVKFKPHIIFTQSFERFRTNLNFHTFKIIINNFDDY